MSSFFYLLKKEPMVLSDLVEFGPVFTAETVKPCALIGLYMKENALRSDRDPSPHFGDLREMCMCGCPESPVWSGDGFQGDIRAHCR